MVKGFRLKSEVEEEAGRLGNSPSLLSMHGTPLYLAAYKGSV